MNNENSDATKSAALFAHHCNPLFAAYRILNKGGATDEETVAVLEGARQDFIKRMRGAAEQVTEETGGIAKTHFYDIANIAADNKWDSPKKVNLLFGIVRNLGIRGVDVRCNTCINGKENKSRLFKETFNPLVDAIKLSQQKKPLEKKDLEQLKQLERRFKHGLSTTIQEYEKHKAIIDKATINHLYNWANVADWKRPDELEAIYTHGCAVLGQPARPPNKKLENYGFVPNIASHAGIANSRIALEDALNYPAAAAQLHSRTVKGFGKRPTDFTGCRNNYINKLLFHASNENLNEIGGITKKKLLGLARQARRQDWKKGPDARQAYAKATRTLGKKPVTGLNNAWSGKAQNRPRTTTATRLRR